MFRVRFEKGFGAGAGAALAVILAMALLRVVLGVPSIPELLQGAFLRLVPGDVFEFMIHLLGPGAKVLLLILILEGMLAAGGGLGRLLVHTALPAVAASPRWRRLLHDQYGAGTLFGILIGVALAALFFLMYLLGVMNPQPRSSVLLPVSLSLLSYGLLFGLVLVTLLPPAAPGPPAGAATVAGAARRGFLRLAGGTALALVAGSGLWAALTQVLAEPEPAPLGAPDADGSTAIAESNTASMAGSGTGTGETPTPGAATPTPGSLPATLPPAAAPIARNTAQAPAAQAPAATPTAPIPTTPPAAVPVAPTPVAPTRTDAAPAAATSPTRPAPGPSARPPPPADTAVSVPSAPPSPAPPEATLSGPPPAIETAVAAAQAPEMPATAGPPGTFVPTLPLARPTPTTMPFPAVPVLPPEITPAANFYITTKNLIDPLVDAGGWRLTISGLVEQPLSLTFDQIKALPPVTVVHTLECISNPVGGSLIGNGRWTGVRLADLLKQVRPRSGVSDVVLRGADDYSDSVPLSALQQGNTLLAYALNGRPLPARHGYPVRLLVPGIFGMKNVKWLTDIELVNVPYQGFWQVQGWSRPAPYLTMSRIDYPRPGIVARQPLYVGGVAFAGNRGIQRVEVSVDGGATWAAAQVRRPLGPNAWVLWTWPWIPPAPGVNTLVVRATDGTGQVQTAAEHNNFPNGATGYHRVQILVG